MVLYQYFQSERYMRSQVLYDNLRSMFSIYIDSSHFSPGVTRQGRKDFAIGVHEILWIADIASK